MRMNFGIRDVLEKRLRSVRERAMGCQETCKCRICGFFRMASHYSWPLVRIATDLCRREPTLSGGTGGRVYMESHDFERRKAFRHHIQPPQVIPTRIVFADDQRVEGRIVDLSMTGLAVRLTDNCNCQCSSCVI